MRNKSKNEVGISNEWLKKKILSRKEIEIRKILTREGGEKEWRGESLINRKKGRKKTNRKERGERERDGERRKS